MFFSIAEDTIYTIHFRPILTLVHDSANINAELELNLSFFSAR